ncbi:YhdP family protein [Sulfuriflexus mobilis]|uniref:YhdP family protein n=1 Tax=Sulfuriflexus mobilis TaxID=1811807 RepID=UPI0015587FDB|nr:YhdP family protein [Sulfuriflexus mobilis]
MKFKHPLIRAAFATLWYSVASFVVLAAILVTLARLVLPLATDYRDEAEQLLSRYSGQTIRISSLHADWSGLGPHIFLEDVRLYDTEGKKVRLQFAEARIGIDILASILRQDLVPSSLTISGVQLSFTRHLDGSVSVHGLTDGEDKSESREDYSGLIAAWLFRQPEIGVTTSSLYWSDEKSGVKDLFFKDVYLRLRNDQSRHQIEGSLILPEDLGDAFSFAIDLQGDLLDPLGWIGNLYVKGKNFVIPQWWPRSILKDISLANGVANFELWADWKEGRLQLAEGNVQTERLDFAGTRGEGIPLTALQSEFSWQRLEHGWTVQLDGFSPRMGEQAWPESRLSLITYTDEDRYELSAGYMRVGDVINLSRVLGFVDDKQYAPLLGLQPQAELRNLVANYSPRSVAGHRLHIESDFTDLQTKPWRDLPAAVDFSGHLVTDLEKGHLHLDSRAARLDYPTMFRDSLALDVLQGDVYWRDTEAGWQIDAPGLLAKNQDISLDVRLSMLLPLEGAAYVDLVGYFRDGNGKQAGKYLPVAVIPDNAVAWLDKAIVGGYIPAGGLVLHGPMDKFPFEGGEGKFEVRFDVEGGVLDYQPGWPVFNEVNAEVVFSGRGMQINGHSGRILGSTVKSVRVEFADLSADIPDLYIHGLMDVQTPDVLDYVVRSGLGKEYEKTLQRLQTSGTGELELALRLSLGHGKDHLSGRMRFDDNTVALRDQDISLQKLHGQVSVVDGQFRGEGLHAQLMGAPLDIRVQPGKKNDIALNIQARARLDLNARLRQHLGKSIPDIMPGTSDWLLELHIPNAGAKKREEAKLVLSSDLQGVSIAAPTPLGKTAKQKRPLTLSMGVGDTRLYPLALTYDDVLNAEVELGQDFSLQRGELAIGRASTGLPDKPGLLVSARLEKLAINEWRDYARGLGLLGDRAKQSPTTHWLSALQLEVEQLEAFNMLFRQVRLDGMHEDDRWQFDIHSDRLAGRVSLEDGAPLQQSLKLELAYLKLQRTQSDSVTTQYDPRDIPGFELTVEKFLFDEMELGRLTANVKHIPEGLYMEHLQLEGKHVSLGASGEWAVSNDEQNTRLQVKLNSDAFSEFLEGLGYESGFQAGKSKGDAQLQWPGDPMQFSVGRLNGNLSLDIRDGQLRDLSPGAGRVFGLLSLQTLPRRLSLDFSDVFKKGFSFDRIKGNFQLEKGDAYTTNLYMDGPAARIDVSGRTGLVVQDYDQLVTVTPKLTSSLPLAGALVGGPVAGGVLYAIDKLFKPAIDKITRYQYTITGSWEEPEIVKLDKADVKAQ